MTKALLLLIGFVFVGFLTVVSPYVVNYEPDESINNEILKVTTSRPLLGTKKCTRGPSYWCYNITQAKECGAVKHCIEKTWEPMQLPTDNDSVCEICKEMVKEAREQLLSNETQDDLRDVFEGSCKLIPLQIVSDECCKLADEFIPELVDTLASRMDPQVVCAVSGLCNSIRIDEMLGQMKEIEEKTDKFDLMTDSCPKCSHFIGKAITSLKSFNKDQLLQKMFEVCGHLGSYSDGCRASVMDDIDSIYPYIQNELNALEACGLVGLCEVVSINPVRIEGSPNGVRVWSPPTTNVGDSQCDFCKQLVTYLKQWFTTETTKEEFMQIVTGLCKETGKYAQECLKMANEYGDLVYNLIVEELDPEKACIFLEQCNVNVTDSIRGRVTLFSSASNPAPLWTILHSDDFMAKLTPAEKLTGDDESPSHQPGFAYPMMPLSPAEEPEGSEEELLLTSPMTRLTPAERMTGQVFTPIVAKKGVRDILPTCAICTFTVGKLFDLLAGKNMTKESVDRAVESVCYVVPARYKDQCLTFMKEYGDRVAEMIVIEGSAHAVCTALHLCLMSPQPEPPTLGSTNVVLVEESELPFDRFMPQVMVDEELNKEGVEKPFCALCEFVVARLDSMLSNNSTEQEIKDTVEQVCNYMPRTVRSECRDFIDEYGDTIIKYLMLQMDPQKICTELTLCKKRKVVTETMEEYPMELSGMNKCELCELISSYLSAFLDNPTVDTSIESMVEQICPLLPVNRQSDCKELIEDYGPYLLSLLAQATEKGKECATINLCPSTQ